MNKIQIIILSIALSGSATAKPMYLDDGRWDIKLVAEGT